MTRVTKSVAAALLAVAALAGCGGDDGSKDSDLAAPFAYDTSKPLQLRTRSTDRGTGGIEVRDISFAGATGGRQDAYLVLPGKRTDRPAVIYAHGAGGDRYELLDEATKLAQQGAVAITLDMSYSPRRARQLPTQGIPGVRARTQVEVDSVRDIRRAVDLLHSLPEVDDERIGYVGWSAGARMGAVAAGVEHRIKAYDLVAGGATPVSEYLSEAPQELRPQLEPILNRTDPLRYVGHASPSALFFQNGSQDEIVPIPALRALADEGSDPKEVRWYDSGHVPTAQAWSDSRTWLADELDLS
ncbi:MAG TPA: acetylxylan esterase [Gaiellaceae bacterium]|nr:acetylxylan esterase [Gaiellaceae bacterium]